MAKAHGSVEAGKCSFIAKDAEVPGDQADHEQAMPFAANGFLGYVSKRIARKLREGVFLLCSALLGPHAGVLSFGLPNKS